MKKYIFTLFSAAALIFASCDDVLERPQLNNPQDDNTGETKRTYVCLATVSIQIIL